MIKIRTPCIGICSTTSVGDTICRGCKRYAFEVIHWNAYSDEEKLAVLRRVEKLNVQILEERMDIQSVERLREELRRSRVPFDETLDPHCWVHNLLKRRHGSLESLDDFGVSVKPAYRHLPLTELAEQIDREILTLCEAHFSRYLATPAMNAG